MLRKYWKLRQVVANLDHSGTFTILDVERMAIYSRKIKNPSNIMRQSASVLIASSMLLTMWICRVEGVLYPDDTQGQLTSVHADHRSHEGDPNAPAQHSHGPSHSDEETDLCCTQLFTKHKSAFRLLIVEGPVAWHSSAVQVGDSYSNRGGSLVCMIDLARGPVEVHEANSYYFALPAHAPPFFS